MQIDMPAGWVRVARCAQIGDPDLFFPEEGNRNTDAKAVCNGWPDKGIPPCPVREQCRQCALARPELYGVWGGLGDFDRSKIRRKRRLAREAAPHERAEVALQPAATDHAHVSQC